MGSLTGVLRTHPHRSEMCLWCRSGVEIKEPTFAAANVGQNRMELRLRFWFEYEIGWNSLISRDSYFLSLRAIGFIPGSDRVLAGSQAVQRERAIFTGHGIVRRFQDHEISSRARSDGAFDRDDFFLSRVHHLPGIGCDWNETQMEDRLGKVAAVLRDGHR